jgi:hypothetical protein
MGEKLKPWQKAVIGFGALADIIGITSCASAKATETPSTPGSPTYSADHGFMVAQKAEWSNPIGRYHMYTSGIPFRNLEGLTDWKNVGESGAFQYYIDLVALQGTNLPDTDVYPPLNLFAKQHIRFFHRTSRLEPDTIRIEARAIETHNLVKFLTGVTNLNELNLNDPNLPRVGYAFTLPNASQFTTLPVEFRWACGESKSIRSAEQQHIYSSKSC